MSAAIGGIGALFVVANRQMTLVRQRWARAIARSAGCLRVKMFKLVEAIGAHSAPCGQPPPPQLWPPRQLWAAGQAATLANHHPFADSC
eukprot:SAG22_NODE_1138_length_5389_cov_22.995085_4_plen_89_part_00